MNLFAQNVNVTPNPLTYPTLKDAFDAINAGTHTGAVIVDIVNSTTETATAALNYSGFGGASYISVVITTSNGAGVTVEGTLGAAAVIRLIGADNVTIDGRVGGSGRNITVRNNGTTANTTAIWISNGPTAIDTAGAQNNTIRNCNISTNVSVTISTSNAFGILLGSSTIGISAGRNNDNNLILDNFITKCRYGIVLHGGAAVSLSQNNRIDSNEIGPNSFGPDAIGKAGVYVQFQNNCSISKNEVKYVGGSSTTTTGGTDRVGIAVGNDAPSMFSTGTTTGTNHTVNANRVHHIRDGRTFSAIGINVATTASGPPTGNVISNNEIYDIIANGTSPDFAGGITHIGNRGDLIIFNSIYMVGDLDPVGEFVGITSRPAIGIYVSTVAGDTALSIRNNSIYVNCTADTMILPTSICIALPSTTYGWGSGGSSNNVYFYNANPLGRIGATGALYPLTTYTTLAAWQGVFTPAQDAGSLNANPMYLLSLPNYLIPANGGSPLIIAGVPAGGITKDILGENRSAFTPSIGAYEFDSVALPVELSSFSASINNRDVVLNWTTASELNNSGYDIERKLLEGNWSKIGFVNGNGTVNSPSDYTYTDIGLATGRYNYRLKQIDFNGNFEYFNLSSEVGVGVPTRFELSQNYPNPFNPTTTINFDLPVDGKVSIKLFDMMGREVATLVNENKTAGYYTLNFNASNYSSGTYFYRIDAGSFVSTKKMMLVK